MVVDDIDPDGREPVLTDGGRGDGPDGAVRDLARAAELAGSGGRSRTHSRRHRRRTRTLVASCAVSLVCLLVIVPSLAAMWFVRSLDSSMAVDGHVSSALTSVPSSSDAFYALVVGSDSRGDERYGRSDSIMLVRVDPPSHRVDVISIPRDMQVRIDGADGPQKINAAYSRGGAALLVSTVSRFAGVPIAHVAQVGFDGLTGLVDRLGGIEVDVPQSFAGGNGGVALQAGRQRLDGRQTLGFVRERYQVQGGDFSRAQAQRLVLAALVSAILDRPATELPGLIQELAANLSTDMSVQDMVRLGLRFRDGAHIEMAGCPSYAFTQDGVSYVGVEYDEWRDMMRRVDAGMGPRGQGDIPQEQRDDGDLGAASNALSPRDYADLVDGSLNSDDVVGGQ